MVGGTGVSPEGSGISPRSMRVFRRRTLSLFTESKGVATRKSRSQNPMKWAARIMIEAKFFQACGMRPDGVRKRELRLCLIS